MPDFQLRKATFEDSAEISKLIEASVRGLAPGYYDPRQIELSILSVFGVDDQLIADETYLVVETEDRIIGCGGWSKRKTLFGASEYSMSRDPELLDPSTDAAKIRAFFIHPSAARKGIASLILDACEAEAAAAGFGSAEMMATLPGIPFYTARGYSGDENVSVPLGETESITCVKMTKELK